MRSNDSPYHQIKEKAELYLIGVDLLSEYLGYYIEAITPIFKENKLIEVPKPLTFEEYKQGIREEDISFVIRLRPKKI